MNCSQVERMLDDWMDGTLSAQALKDLEAHAAECPDCAGKLRATRQLKQMLSEMAPEIDVPLDAQAGWRKAVRAEAGRNKKRLVIRWASGIAAALVVLAGAAFALRQGPIAPARNATSIDSAPMEASDAAEEAFVPEDETIIADEEAVFVEEGEEAFLGDAAMERANAPLPTVAPTAMPMPIPTAEPIYESTAMGTVEADGMMKSEAEASDMADLEEDISTPAPMVELIRRDCDLEQSCGSIGDLVAEYEGTMDVQRFEAAGMAGANLFIEIPAQNAQEFLDAVSAGHDDEGYQNDYAFSGLEGDRVSVLMVLQSKAE